MAESGLTASGELCAGADVHVRTVKWQISTFASGRLVALPVTGLSRKRQLTLVCRRGHRSHAAEAFLAVAQEKVKV